MKQTALLFILAVSLTTHSLAQVGMQVGCNLTNYRYVKSGTHLKRSMAASYNFALMFRTPTRHVSVQPTLLYTRKGAINNDNSANYNISKYKNKLEYLEFSAPVILKAELEGKKNTFDIGVGPYVAKLLSAKSKIEYLYDSSRTTSFKIGDAKTDDFKPIDYGLSFYMGIKVTHFQMNMGYDLGLANVDPKANESIKNRCFSFNIGVFF